MTDTASNAFNNFFIGIGEKLASSVPSVDKSPLSLMPFNQPHSLFLYPITQSEIESEIDALNSSKAVGPYSIPVHILIRLKYLMLSPLEILYNLSISTGTVPDRFKIARVLAVYKKESHMNLSNYRPISLLSVFNRILERLIYHRLINYIDKNNLLYNRQFGFCAKHSTFLAILSITDKIQKAIEDNVYTLVESFETSAKLLTLSITKSYCVSLNTMELEVLQKIGLLPT